MVARVVVLGDTFNTCLGVSLAFLRCWLVSNKLGRRLQSNSQKDEF